MGKIVGQTVFFSLGEATSRLEKENSEKIHYVLQPVVG